jgi:hypothetical protein
MTQKQRNFWISGFNNYVPAMQAGGDLAQNLRQRVNYGALVVASATALLSAQSIAAAVDTTTFVISADAIRTLMGPYGRTVQVVASGAATSIVTVIGRDYLGQPMREVLTLNGTTIVQGVKAFAYIDRVTAGITAGTTINLGTGARFGMAYVTTAVEREFADNVLAAAGTLVAPIFTDPQTTTTGDPRGLYTPTTTPNGVKIIEVECSFSNFVNAANNGGLMGIKHFNV